jgi:hypothetical protein
MQASQKAVQVQASAELKLAFKLPRDEFDKLNKKLAAGDGEPSEALREEFARFRVTCESK